MKLPSLRDITHVAANGGVFFSQQQRISPWLGRKTIEALLFSTALVDWIGLPGHEKASLLLSTLRQCGNSSAFHFPVFQKGSVGFTIAALSAALTPIVLSLSGLESQPNGAAVLVTGWAMCCATRLFDGTQH